MGLCVNATSTLSFVHDSPDTTSTMDTVLCDWKFEHSKDIATVVVPRKYFYVIFLVEHRLFLSLTDLVVIRLP